MNNLSDKKTVLYMFNDAFFECDNCGEQVALHAFRPPLYEGSCKCGTKYELKENKFRVLPVITNENKLSELR